MNHMVSSEVEKARIANWLLNATPIKKTPSWIETRLAIEFGGNTYLLDKEQVYQCARCGHYDPKWSVTEVIKFFKENFDDAKLVEVEVRCSINEATDIDDESEGFD